MQFPIVRKIISAGLILFSSGSYITAQNSPIAINVTPSSVSLAAGETATFSAFVSGTKVPAVQWSLVPPIGTLLNGSYTAPAAISSPTGVMVLATSVVDGTKTASATVWLVPGVATASVSTAIVPGRVTLQPSGVQQFAALLGPATAAGVRWSLNPNLGSVTPSGQYTAPASMLQNQTVTLTATALSNPSVTASALITLFAPAPVPSLPIPAPPPPVFVPGSGNQPPMTYHAISDTVPRAEGPAPPLGPANSVYIDPDFGTRILRVTDQNSIPGKPNVDIIGAAGWQSQFNADSTKFFVNSADGGTYFYQFDSAAFRANVMTDPINPGKPLQVGFGFVSGFSYQDPNILYGMTNGLTRHMIMKYDFSSNRATPIANLDSFLPPADRNWSGYSQSVYNDYSDTNFAAVASKYVVVYNKLSNQAALINLDNSTFQPFNSNTFIPMAGTLPPLSLIHGVQIDKSGRYVAISYADGIDSNVYVDLQAGSWINDPYCHRVMGFGDVVVNCGNQAGNDSDGFYMASLSKPAQRIFLAQNPSGPTRWNTDAHPSWNNARANMALPFLADMRMLSPSIFPPRAWDDELIAVATDGSNKVWRFAHMHAVQTGYYYTVPFARVSPDGQYALINSNWGGTLGTASDIQGSYNGLPSDQKRVDVFLVELNQRYSAAAVDSAPPAPPLFPAGIDGSNISGTINLTASSSDNVGVAAMRYALDGIWQPEIIGLPFTFSLDTTRLSNGYHTVVAFARDAQNNVSLSKVLGFVVNNR